MTAADLPLRDWTALTAIAGGAALGAGLAGAGALHLLRRRAFATQVVVVALTSTLAVTAGALAAGNAMFISAHDLAALSVVLAVAAVAGMLAAFLLAQRVGAASRALGETARRIGDPDAPGGPLPLAGPPSILEFRRLATELAETAARLEDARAREQAGERARRELVAWVSHDLRTPLAGIRAITEALEDGLVTDPETVARYYATLRVESDRLAGLVDDLFELSRINAGALSLAVERVSLGDLVSDALAAAQPVADAKGVRLEGHMNGPVELDGSAPELARVLSNLLDNAIRETPAGRRVSVEAGREDGKVYVAVADGCGGIPDAVLPRVFEPGSGLGLAIARGFVEAHHGALSVANHGPGCRFLVTLPASDPVSDPVSDPSL